jgi:NADH dehydrogenase/NADH:ubiquinone oxidoreductase subunit G
MVHFTINGVEVEASREENVLQVARRYGIYIPALCYHEAVTPYASCRLCIVEAKQGGRTRVVTACTYPARDGLEVQTDTERIKARRRVVMELLLAQAPASEKLWEFAATLGVTSTRFPSEDPDNKCILCGLCERVCREQAGVASISFAYRGRHRKLTTPFEEPPDFCKGCTACAYVCPTGAVEVRLARNLLELQPWKAKVEMAVCTECGTPYAPTAELKEVAEKVKLELPALNLCPACRRKIHAKTVVMGKS